MGRYRDKFINVVLVNYSWICFLRQIFKHCFGTLISMQAKRMFLILSDLSLILKIDNLEFYLK